MLNINALLHVLYIKVCLYTYIGIKLHILYYHDNIIL